MATYEARVNPSGTTSHRYIVRRAGCERRVFSSSTKTEARKRARAYEARIDSGEAERVEQLRDKLHSMSDFPEHREPIRDPEVLKRMGVAFDLYQMAEEMKRQNLRRQNPEASKEEIEQGVREWLRQRPGAEHGDGVGRPRPKPLEL